MALFKLRVVCGIEESQFPTMTCLKQVQGKYDNIIAEVKSYYMSMSGYRDDKKRKVYLHVDERVQG
ncbi:hypothetical protein ZEAMMB73_Zm00001d033570 [Zea mays]|uniref:Uncharacterized protein n=1 Tax=Zea mays TaxID=4577 RepID=A0A1D6L061_MAIZE|nr:hypothetical protein ZEAMMB73_Zm00001d033570 [Zea mays]